jgi:hypothetical protein
MISVILRDGRVVQYNDASNARLSNGEYIIEDGESYWYGRFPIDVIERIDGVKPCRIRKESRDKKTMLKY